MFSPSFASDIAKRDRRTGNGETGRVKETNGTREMQFVGRGIDRSVLGAGRVSFRVGPGKRLAHSLESRSHSLALCTQSK